MAVVMYGKKCGFGNEEGSIRLVSCLNKIFRKGKCLPRPCGWFSTARGDGRSVESSKKFDKRRKKVRKSSTKFLKSPKTREKRGLAGVRKDSTSFE